MNWNNLKKTAENLLAESLNGRVKYHITQYGKGDNYFMSRAWITFDKKEIASFSTIKRYQECYNLTGKHFSHDPKAMQILDKNGLFTRDNFGDALKEYIGLQVEEAVESKNPIVKAIAMLDRRLGKRKIKSLSFNENEHPIVVKFYRIRCQAEEVEKT